MTENQPKQVPTLQSQNIKEKGIYLKKERCQKEAEGIFKQQYDKKRISC